MFKLPKDMLDSSSMSSGGAMHKLMDMIDWIKDISVGQYKMLKADNHTLIYSRICIGFSTMKGKVRPSGYWRGD